MDLGVFLLVYYMANVANISTNILGHFQEKKYICNICNFSCCKNYDFNRHLSTAKHRKMAMANICSSQKAPVCNFTPDDNSKQYSCYCGKKYKHRSSLSKHKKTCKYIEKNIENSEKNIQTIGKNEIIETNQIMNDFKSGDISKDVILKILQENTDIKEMMVKQYETMKHQQKTLETQQKQIGEMIPKIGNNNVTNVNTVNNRFNINIFLNEQCRDAINMNDFIKQINISLEDLDITKNRGLTEGLSNLLIENINKLSIYERPVHCTDIKRETLYIKDDDRWEKDGDKTRIKSAIKDLTQIQYKNMKQWMDANPDYMDNPDKQDYFIDLVRRCSSNLDDIDGKVIKRVCNNVNIKTDIKEDSLDD
mgnify:CR=1 FL=1